MAGLVPAIHVLLTSRDKGRGCPGHLARRRASRFCPGMTNLADDKAHMTLDTEAARAPSAVTVPSPLLSVRNIEVVYDDVILVLRGLSLEVSRGAIVALLGANGAGKSTTLKAISGLLTTEDGEVTRAGIVLHGERIHSIDPDQIVLRCIVQL